MEASSNPEKREISHKEQRLKDILLMYYSREDVRRALYEFSKNRECVPRYGEGFGKRPDTFQYESDILAQVRKGATSFHCSEELWSDPLEISTDMKEEEINRLRVGWDLLLDIDSPYLEFSKVYASSLIRVLKEHGIQNLGVKFSGSKGFHIIVPWRAFPEMLYGQETKLMFPLWPRLICNYLTQVLQKELENDILNDSTLAELAKKTGKKEEDLLIRECLICHRPAVKKILVNWKCSHCKNEIVNVFGTYNNRKKPKCPECRAELLEVNKKEIYNCSFCNIGSDKNPQKFGEVRARTEKLIEADLVLVASRHLFRMPYSLHEKTALASIVLDPEKIPNFQLNDANALKVQIKNFYPNPKKDEAKELLIKAIDLSEQKKQKQEMEKEFSALRQNLSIETHLTDNKVITSGSGSKGTFKKVEIASPSEEIFPPCIKHILSGIKDDGRKRALFILISFFTSLGVSPEYLEKRLNDWNEKNYNKLKQGYINSQIMWYKKQGSKMPPNCDKTNYNDLNACKPDNLCKTIKNPVNYAVKKHFRLNK